MPSHPQYQANAKLRGKKANLEKRNFLWLFLTAWIGFLASWGELKDLWTSKVGYIYPAPLLYPYPYQRLCRRQFGGWKIGFSKLGWLARHFLLLQGMICMRHLTGTSYIDSLDKSARSPGSLSKQSVSHVSLSFRLVCIFNFNISQISIARWQICNGQTYLPI